MSVHSTNKASSNAASWCCWLDDSDSSDDEFDITSKEINDQRMRDATHVNKLGERVHTFVEIKPGEFATNDYVREQNALATRIMAASRVLQKPNQKS